MPTELQKNVETPVAGENHFSSPTQLIDQLDPFEGDHLMDHIYEKYAEAMRLRDREPLERDRFQKHFFGGGNIEESLTFGSKKDGYLLGSKLNNVFVPTHFAPETMKGGYRVIKDVIASDISVALFVTDDLVATITKMEGWKVFPIRMKAWFSGEEVEKTLVVSHWKVLPKLVMHEIGKIGRENRAKVTSKVLGIGEKIKEVFQNVRGNTDEIEAEIQDAILDKELASQSEIAKIQQRIMQNNALFEDEEEVSR